MILEGLTSALALQVGNLFHAPTAAPLSPLPLETVSSNSHVSRPIENVMKKTSSNGIYVHGSARNILPVGTFTRDAVVVGGGLAGLSTALELCRRGVRVTVLSDDIARSASAAAGGMIAPQAEMLPESPYLDLCLRSRAMYYPWVQMIETMSSTISGNKVDVGLKSNRGFIAPAFEGDAVHRWSPPKYAGQIKWLNKEQLREMEPLVSENIIGGWWYPQDMHVDTQALLKALHDAVVASGGEILEGVGAKRLMYGMYGDHVESIALTDSRYILPGAVIAASGAWMGELVPIKMEAIKGQVVSVKLPKLNKNGILLSSNGHPLYSVLFADGAYLIPRQDGSIIAGGTTERGVWDSSNTPRGISHVSSVMSKVCPSLNDFTIERTWSGLRPTTEDYFPVLGASKKCENLFMCGGFWRNGVLLPPKAAQLVADAVVGAKFGEEDVRFMEEFSPDRFDGSTGNLISPPRYMAFSSSSSSSSNQESNEAFLSPSTDGVTPSLPTHSTVTEDDGSRFHHGNNETFNKLTGSPVVKKDFSLDTEEENEDSSSSNTLENNVEGAQAKDKLNADAAAMEEKHLSKAADISFKNQEAFMNKEESQGEEDSTSIPPRFTEEELQQARESNRDMFTISEDFDSVLGPNIEDGDRAPSWSPEATRVAKKFGAKLVPDPRGSWHPPSSDDEIFAIVVDGSTGEEVVFPSSDDSLDISELPSTQAENSSFMLASNVSSLGTAASGVIGVQPQRSAEVQALYESILKTRNQEAGKSSIQPGRKQPSPVNRKSSHKNDSPLSWLTGLLRMRQQGGDSSAAATTTLKNHEVAAEVNETASNQLYGYDRVKERLKDPVQQDLVEVKARRASASDDDKEDERRFEEIAKNFPEISV